MTPVLAATALAAFLASLLVSALAVRGRVLDLPNERSAHTKATPRAGGLGLIAGLGAGVLAASFFPLDAGSLGPVLLITGLFAALGFADDLLDLSEVLKFLVFVGLCLGMVWAAGPVTRFGLTLDFAVSLPIWLGVLGSVLFVFTVVNAVNFMDGSDAMLVAVMGPAGAGLSIAGLVAGELTASLMGLALAGGCLGFAIFNRPPARAFAGDVGALGAGAAYAGAALAMAGQGFSGSLWLAPMFVLVFLVDVLLTLLRRALTGRLKLTAHAEHAYQRLIRKGWSHGCLAMIYGGLTLAIVVTGLIAAQGPDGAVPAAFAVWALALSVLYALAGRIAPD
jgi:UDP-N-acetylmuramyl pentapeptide phosphotransferase/UDP-N-acetylglucosamine-1-phosphate transferase